MIHTYCSFGYGRHARMGQFVGAAFWGVFPAAGLIAGIADRNAAFFLGAVGFAVVWMWPMYTDLFRRAYEIRIWETGRLEFEAPLRTFRLGAHELVSIRPAKWTINDRAYLVIRHQGGKFWLAWPLHDIDDFIGRLSGLNPAVVIEESETLAPELPEKTTATTREVIRASPIGAAIVLAIVGVVCFLALHEHVGPVGAVATGVVIWVALMFGVGRGWVRFDD
jgi:hypothetical protein